MVAAAWRVACRARDDSKYALHRGANGGSNRIMAKASAAYGSGDGSSGIIISMRAAAVADGVAYQHHQ